MVAIRELQHFLYCPHRWELLYQENAWQDNVLTVLAGLVHERVHSEKTLQSSSNKIVLSGVSIYSKNLGIHGKTDALELVPDKDGIKIEGYNGLYSIQIIEYKPTAPKGEPLLGDKIQVLAQLKCVEELFSVKAKAYLYYADIRRRVALTFSQEEEETLLKLIAQINEYKDNGCIPPARYSEKCNGCSLFECCMPKTKPVDVKKKIIDSL